VTSSWLALWRRLALLFLGAALLGWSVGHPTLALLLTALGCLIWQLGQLYRLDRWLRGDRNASPPRLGWVWDDVAAHLARLRRQSRKRKRKLSKLFQQFQQATAALPDAAVVLGEDDRMVWCNGAAQRLLGLSPARDVGRPIVHLVRHPSFVTFLTQRRSGDGVEFPSPVDDALLLGARLVPYGKKQRLLLAADVSQLRRLEQMRRDFVANVSHELRTPVSVIRANAETLLGGAKDDPAFAGRLIDGLHRNAERLARIIADLLDLSRLEAGHYRIERTPVDVLATAQQAVAALERNAAAKQVNVRLDVAAGVSVIADGKALDQILVNLIDNAIKYTSQAGNVVVEARALGSDARGRVRITVADDGPGIAAHHRERIFERFYRVDPGRSRDVGGTGLGLSIVKHLVESMGGTVGVEGNEPSGTVFWIELPAAGVA